MLRRRVALTVALLTVAALLAALMPWSGSGAADKPKDTTAGTLEEVHQPTAVLLPSSGTVAEYVPNAAEVEALAKLKESNVKHDATVLTEIGYIKANTDEIKAEQKEQRKTNTEFVTRLTDVEASAKQAHKRLDHIEKRMDQAE